jgi:predicted dehydrogenase
MLNVGIIGLGKMGKLHFMNCKHIDNVKVLSVADVSNQNLSWAKARGIQNLYSDYADLIENSGVDAVIIALPHNLHVHSSTLALENGIDVFLEKPLAVNLDDGKNIIDVVNKTKQMFMVGCNSRFHDSVEKVKNLYDNGVLGDIEIANFDNIGNGPLSPFLDPTPIPDWYFDPKKVGGGALLDLGYHMVDLYQWFFKDIKLEFAYLSNRYNLPFEDSVILIVNSDNTKTKGIINLGWFSRSIFPKLDFRVILHGTVDFASTDNYMPDIYWNAISEGTRNILRKMVHKKIKPLSYAYYYYSYYKELDHFFNCIITSQEPIISPKESFKTLELIDEVYRKYPRHKYNENFK